MFSILGKRLRDHAESIVFELVTLLTDALRVAATPRITEKREWVPAGFVLGQWFPDRYVTPAPNMANVLRSWRGTERMRRDNRNEYNVWRHLFNSDDPRMVGTVERRLTFSF